MLTFSSMTSQQIAALLGPLFSLIVFGVIALGIKWLIATYLPDSWLKREILRERIRSKYSASNRRVLEQASRHPRGKS